jgi:ABC-type nitrate/sulfonate/bicarbonate transport system substrate-binding protein
VREPRASAIILLTALLAACGGTATPATPVPSAASPAASAAGSSASSAPSAAAKPAAGVYIPWWIAHDEGIFARNGLAVDMKFMAGATSTAAMVGGAIEAATISPPQNVDLDKKGWAPPTRSSEAST